MNKIYYKLFIYITYNKKSTTMSENTHIPKLQLLSLTGWLRLLSDKSIEVLITHTNVDGWVESKWFAIYKEDKEYYHYIDYINAWRQLKELEIEKASQSMYFRMILESVEYIEILDGFRKHKIFPINTLFECINGLCGVKNDFIFSIIQYSVKYHLEHYHLPIPRKETLSELLQGYDSGYDVEELIRRKALLSDISCRQELFDAMKKCGI